MTDIDMRGPWSVDLDNVEVDTPLAAIEIHDCDGVTIAKIEVDIEIAKGDHERSKWKGEMARRIALLPTLWGACDEELATRLRNTEWLLKVARREARRMAEALCREKSELFMQFARGIGERYLADASSEEEATT